MTTPDDKAAPTREEIETAKLAILLVLDNMSRNMHTTRQNTSNARGFAAAPVISLYPPDSTKAVKNYLNPFKTTPEAGAIALGELRDAAPPLVNEESSGRGHTYAVTPEGSTLIQAHMREHDITLEETTLAMRSLSGIRRGTGSTRA